MTRAAPSGAHGRRLRRVFRQVYYTRRRRAPLVVPPLTHIPVALAVALSVFAAPASAGAASAAGGGVFAAPAPAVADAHCARRCPAVRTVTPGTSVVQLVGRHLGAVSVVRFAGAAGGDDDRAATASPVSDTVVEVTVPAGARTGPVQAVSGGGQVSPASAARLTVATTTALDSAPVDLAVSAPKAGVSSATPATLGFLVRSGAASHVDVRRDGATAPAATWDMPATQAGTVLSVRWDGRAKGRTVAGGRYRFTVTPAGGAAASATFQLRTEVFPIAGAHRFGTGAGRYGAGRGGRSHEGQDIFARCGTPLVAARAGTVQDRKFQSAAGNYLVIDLDGSAKDDMYAHLKAPATVKVGQHLTAGQSIGQVGDTGDADGCHLHFEAWGAPGWYEGGAPYDPNPLLRQWDKSS